MAEKKKRCDIPKPKEDIRIEKDKPKFNSALSQIVKPKKKDEGTN
jgi:hypothetical protein